MIGLDGDSGPRGEPVGVAFTGEEVKSYCCAGTKR